MVGFYLTGTTLRMGSTCEQFCHGSPSRTPASPQHSTQMALDPELWSNETTNDRSKSHDSETWAQVTKQGTSLVYK